MRLINLIKVVPIIFFIFNCTNLRAQKHDSAYWNSWSKLYKCIDSSFINRKDTCIVEQSALVQFVLSHGKVDTFLIWSAANKKSSDWLIPILKPVIGNYFEGYSKFKYVVVPINSIDTRHSNRTINAYEDFVINFVDAFKHFFNQNFTIAQGILLEPQWQSVE